MFRYYLYLLSFQDRYDSGHMLEHSVLMGFKDSCAFPTREEEREEFSPKNLMVLGMKIIYFLSCLNFKNFAVTSFYMK